MSKLTDVMVIGPVYPYKGGIAHYTGLMSKAFAKKYNTQTVSYKLQYPRFMFKKEQRDYGNKTFEVQDARFMINTINPFNWIGTAIKINKQRPELLVVQWWHPYFAPCYKLMLSLIRHKHTKIMFVCHNVLPHERFVMDRFLTKMTLRTADACVVQSKEDEKNLKELLPGMPYERTVHPTYQAFRLRGIDKMTARRELGESDDTKILLFFGLVRPYKGLKHLVNAMPEIVSRLNNVKLYIVGDFGDAKDEYMKLIEDNGIKENIVIRDGYVPDKEVEPYFAAADVNICPYETATQSGIIQIAYGFDLPVIATNVGGLPEVVTDSKTGYVVEPCNAAAISDAVCRYFEDNRQADFIEGVRNEKERFSWDHAVEVFERLYEKVCSSNTGI